MSTLSRRRFVQGAGAVLAAGGLAFVVPICWRLSREEENSVASGLIPARPAPLDSATRERLWSLFIAIGHRWSMLEGDGLPLRGAFNSFVNAKCEEEPSYSSEYLAAVRWLESQTGPDAALLALRESSCGARLAHIKHFVVKEFADLHLISGGFRHFGYRNYAGFMGGPLLNRPYR